MQVTVAGTIATWCFDKTDASGCCSPAVYNSLYRSLTYSLGSICLGSLLQGLISMLRYMIESTRQMQERERQNNECSCVGSILLCLVDCIAKFLEDIVDYFNQWAVSNHFGECILFCVVYTWIEVFVFLLIFESCTVCVLGVFTPYRRIRCSTCSSESMDILT